VGHNVQIAVDTKHKVIVEQQVTNQVLDLGVLTPTAEPAKHVLGVETIAVVADRGYFKIEDLEACEQAGMRPYVPRPLRELKKTNYTNKLACDACTIRSRCTGGRFRTVSRLENEAVLDRMPARIVRRPDILNQRRETVEHPFGSIKQWMNQGAFLMRGLQKVRAEISVTALAYNLRRVLNIVGFPALMQALQA
jgi:IS5 family transposase